MMKTVNGVYTSAKIFTDTIENYAMAQIQLLCDHEALKECRARVMPDVHPGKVGTIGFTSTLGGKILPNVVGIDIGCGLTIAKIKQRNLEFQRLDKVIREHIPSGFQIRKKPHRFSEAFECSRMHCAKAVNQEKAYGSLGTLGGGNHFIEVDQGQDGTLYAAIHSGSRHLGKEVTEYYLKEGQKKLKARGIEVPYEWTYLETGLMEQYLHDLEIVQAFAELNRRAMLDELSKGMKWKIKEVYSLPHNYVDHSGSEPILRKGAVSAKAGEFVAIPMNMRDGILLGEGLGNPEWNESSPHGSGRIMSRELVKNHHTVSQFKEEMKGIYCSCIGKETLDESPFAYRNMEEIVETVSDTVQIKERLRPVYNFKAGSKERG